MIIPFSFANPQVHYQCLAQTRERFSGAMQILSTTLPLALQAEEVRDMQQ